MKITSLDHIGIPTEKMEETAAFYEKLGFTLAGKFNLGEREFLFYEAGGVVLELIPSMGTVKKNGAVDHFALAVPDIDEAFAFCKAQGFTLLNENVITIASFWDHGCKCFNILGPNDEKIEFCQKM